MVIDFDHNRAAFLGVRLAWMKIFVRKKDNKKG